MNINGERLIGDLKKLREITATPGKGVTRFSYSEEDGRAREYLKEISREYGFSYVTDAIGNIRIAPQNSRGKTIIGSHIDTVRNGGWLDGVYGVISGMEVLRTLAEEGVESDLLLYVYAEEEGSVFGSTMTGSKFLSGKYLEKDLDILKDDQGRTLREYLKALGYLKDEKKFAADLKDVDNILEIHIEQGPVLEDQGLEIGIVDTIFGMHVLEVTFRGLGNHAGASPMIGRRDPFSAVAEAALAIEKAVTESPELQRTDSKKAVCTIGRIRVSPDCSNVIPDSCWFTVDIRSGADELTEKVTEKVKDILADIAEKRNIEIEIEDVADSGAIPLSQKVIKKMDDLAAQKGHKYLVMDSGAVHDTAMLAPYADAGMIFVPSINGRSHVPEEDTKEEDLIRGAQFLMDYVEAWALN